MVNKPRKKGTAAETAVVRHARANGFPHADRQPLRGNRDCGDLTLCPGVIVEVKNYAGGPGLGRPAPNILALWLDQTELERTNAAADLALLVVKRSGSADPATWWCYVRLGDFLHWLGANITAANPMAPVCMSLQDVLRQLRRTGYGEPLDADAQEVPA